MIREEEFPEHVRGKPHDDLVVEEFEQDIDLFRGWVLNSSLVELHRHLGELEGELGLKVKKSCVHETIRGAVPVLAFEISNELRDVVEGTGVYIVVSRPWENIFAVWLPGAVTIWSRAGDGMVQGVIDWKNSVGARLKAEPE